MVSEGKNDEKRIKKEAFWRPWYGTPCALYEPVLKAAFRTVFVNSVQMRGGGVGRWKEKGIFVSAIVNSAQVFTHKQGGGSPESSRRSVGICIGRAQLQSRPYPGRPFGDGILPAWAGGGYYRYATGKRWSELRPPWPRTHRQHRLRVPYRHNQTAAGPFGL